jgi:hypothetical protein
MRLLALALSCLVGVATYAAPDPQTPMAPQSPDDDDAAALALPGADSAAAPQHAAAAVLVEGAYTEATQNGGVGAEQSGGVGAAPGCRGDADAQRLSLDVSDNSRLASTVSVVFGDRLDLDWAGAWNAAQEVNTLKQAYLSWQPQTNALLDAGRINARQGVAYGYNPTDFFRANAVRAVDSLDPNSLRDDRLGTVMARGQALWDGGAVTALYAPRLSTDTSTAPLSPDFGATNSAGHWLVSLTQRITADISPQWLLFGTDSGQPQAGVDLTALLGSSTVAFVEASAGRSASLLSQAFSQGGGRQPPLSVEGQPATALATPVDSFQHGESLRSRVSTGFTYSAPNKLSVTLEYEYDGAALGRAGWNALRNGPLEDYGVYRNYVNAQQELATQHSVFVYASWNDLIIRHLDAAAFVRVDLIDHSRLPWTELRYHWSHIDAALRWQDYVGGATTDFGAAATGQTWQLVLDYYL